MRCQIKDSVGKSVGYEADHLMNKKVEVVELVGADVIISYGGANYSMPLFCVDILPEEPIAKPKEIKKAAAAKRSQPKAAPKAEPVAPAKGTGAASPSGKKAPSAK
jgi:hypothetical protein